MEKILSLTFLQTISGRLFLQLETGNLIEKEYLTTVSEVESLFWKYLCLTNVGVISN